MAELRKSARETDARRRARDKAAQFRELQDTLEQLATDYFVAVDSIEEANDETERSIAKLRARAKQMGQKARTDADHIVARMVEAGASAPEVATRLGVQVRDIKRVIKATPATPATASSAYEASADVAPDQDGAGE
jgi:hypothetical protein